jgi:hypothetical protein
LPERLRHRFRGFKKKVGKEKGKEKRQNKEECLTRPGRIFDLAFLSLKAKKIIAWGAANGMSGTPGIDGQFIATLKGSDNTVFYCSPSGSDGE